MPPYPAYQVLYPCYIHVEIAHFSTRWIIGTCKAQGRRPDDTQSREMCDFCTGMGSCFYPMTCKKYHGSHACTFSPWIVSWSWNNMKWISLLTITFGGLSLLPYSAKAAGKLTLFQRWNNPIFQRGNNVEMTFFLKVETMSGFQRWNNVRIST